MATITAVGAQYVPLPDFQTVTIGGNDIINNPVAALRVSELLTGNDMKTGTPSIQFMSTMNGSPFIAQTWTFENTVDRDTQLAACNLLSAQLVNKTELAALEALSSRIADAVLVAGTVTVTIDPDDFPALTANSRVFIQLKTAGGTAGVHYAATVNVGAGTFTIQALSVAGALVATDTSTVTYSVVEIPS